MNAFLLLLVIAIPDGLGADECLAGQGSCTAKPPSGWPSEPPQNEAVRPTAKPVPKGRNRASILEQEMFELDILAELYHRRLGMLEDLQKGLQMGLGRHLNLSTVRALQQNVPPLSEQVLLGVPPGMAAAEEDSLEENTDSVAGSTSTAAAVDDFLVSKAVIPQDSSTTHLGFMPLRNHRSSAPAPTSQVAMPTVLLVAIQADGDICLYTVSGDLAFSFPSGHKQAITQLAVSPMQDEYVLATADVGGTGLPKDRRFLSSTIMRYCSSQWLGVVTSGPALALSGTLRVHRVYVRPRRSPQEQKRRVTNPDEEKVSSHLGSPANITVQYNLRTKVPLVTDTNSSEEAPQLTALIMTSVQGVKYFVAGDSSGWISVLTRNGTLHGRLQVSDGLPVGGISAHLGNVVYVAGYKWGFLDLEKVTARSLICHKFETSLVHVAVTDTALQSRVIVADQDGTVWVFATRDKRDCKVEHRFPRMTSRAPLSLSSVRGFVLSLELSRGYTGRSELIAFNMSHVGKGWDDSERDVSPIAWRRSSRPVHDWAVQRRYQEGDLLAILSQDGMEIEIFELMMQVYQPPPGDLLGNFKLPVFAAAMILVMGYQFVKQKGPFDPGVAEEG